MATVSAPALPPIPQDAMEFATQQGVAEYMRPVLELARRIFPDARLTIRLEPDAETGEALLLLEAAVTGFAAKEYSERDRSWATELGQVCPSKKTPLFALIMVEA